MNNIWKKVNIARNCVFEKTITWIIRIDDHIRQSIPELNITKFEAFDGKSHPSEILSGHILKGAAE